ncbi:hypothetical protein Cgig2_023859 [Carnegiea gigantea]|uniref:Uncharacterized protein n=1 Tax=Carnegiea gigantea TaxID=171969 RepID=A0A9Q1GTC9_9CARY|nr:hypothetical protein Cgig2_023859 [Carnegiea gigantea]
MKRGTTLANPSENIEEEDVEMAKTDLGSPNAPDTTPLHAQAVGRTLMASYRDTLQRNNSNLRFETQENPIWEAEGVDDVFEDDEPLETDDPTCPTILLTAAEKHMLQAAMKSEDMQGNNKDGGVHTGETELANEINQENLTEGNKEIDTENPLGKENIP